METFYAITGILMVIILLIYIGTADDIVDFTNASKEDKELMKDKMVTPGCLALIYILWELFGLCTSQWFYCLIYFLIGGIIGILCYGFPKSKMRIYIGICFDILFTLFIIINVNWLHLDLFNWLITNF